MDNRAVAPRTGVVLMVVITIILTLTTGTFVLDLGQQSNGDHQPVDIQINQDKTGTGVLIALNIAVIGFLWRINENIATIAERIRADQSGQSRAAENKSNFESSNHEPDASELQEGDK